MLPFGLASIDTTRLPSYEVNALRVIGRKLGKDWDFNKDPCLEWIGSPANNTYDDTVLCNCTESNGTICHVISMYVSLPSKSKFMYFEVVVVLVHDELRLIQGFL
ncbi:hypothetical protein Hanom_Chr11g00983801 [Helianthus anomalus]